LEPGIQHINPALGQGWLSTGLDLIPVVMKKYTIVASLPLFKTMKINDLYQINTNYKFKSIMINVVECCSFPFWL